MIAPTLRTIEELRPSLEKLEHEGDVVLIAIEKAESCCNCHARWAWFSPEEKNASRRALEATALSVTWTQMAEVFRLLGTRFLDLP